MKFEQQQILSAMEATGIIPVFNHTDIDTAIGVLDAAYKGGVKVFEFTNRGANALEVFTALSAHAEEYEDLELGIGTSFNDEDARKFVDAGAHFVVSPAFIPANGVFCDSQPVVENSACGRETASLNAN